MKSTKQKEHIIEMLKTLQSPAVLDALEKLLFKFKYEEECNTPMSNAYFEKEMELSLKDLAEGNVISSTDLQKEILTW